MTIPANRTLNSSKGDHLSDHNAMAAAINAGGGGGGGGGSAGINQITPTLLADVDLLTISIGGTLSTFDYNANRSVGTDQVVYTDPLGTGVGATLSPTGGVNGLLTIDGVATTAGMRVAIFYREDGWLHAGIYNVTDPGAVGRPWLLTRSTDLDTFAKRNTYWIVKVKSGTVFHDAQIRSCLASSSPSDMTVSITGSNDGQYPRGLALGEDNLVLGQGSFAHGQANTIKGEQSMAIGEQNIVDGDQSVVSGEAGWAYTDYSFVQSVLNDDLGNVSPYIVYGASQRSSIVRSAHTSDRVGDSQTRSMSIIFPDTRRAGYVRARIVGKRGDAVGELSVWTFEGLYDGDGVGGYRWVGGVAPTVTLVGQDAGALTWLVTVNIGTNISVEVTGETGKVIRWVAVFDLDESCLGNDIY